MKLIAVDYKNSAERWWDAARNCIALPLSIGDLIVGDKDEVTLSEEDAAAALAWARSLPGWDGGPEYAPHPLTVHDTDI